MIDLVLFPVLPALLVLLNIYIAGALVGWWTFFGVPVSFRP
jgi:hypothetical protein